ncbi:Putative transporter C543,05c [Schizosaccharomyces pombe 972h-] [Rhizoctonia solani]|uniref:Putative transporter C543,05c [Schizosaccharomyces pombe 972h-] n=1 Tax=Rhizoctonia solani TaxID=456999 RepID=A0A0K6FQ95_9AGAM|nr:Putative transporter C543,05c [Schizosaccharomyces pombe 972h-] [Rhizoctonia solani]
MAAFIFSVFSCQPLCIAGVTGPITVLNKTIYDILQTQDDTPEYLHFIGWVYFWAAIMHWIAAALNAANFLRYVTRFSCDTSVPSPFVLSSLTNVRHSVVACTALAYWGRFNLANTLTLPTSGAFSPAGNRPWLVKFWELDGKWVGIALPFGFVLFILFYFDHNVSSLIAQGSEFPLRKPPGFHWDFFWLGITTFIAGLLGIPAPNGLIPQAPMHTSSLVIMGIRRKDDPETSSFQLGPAPSYTQNQTSEGGETLIEEHPVGVVEQRVSNLAQGTLCLVLMTGPFQHVLGLVPRGVLAGLFWFMGTDALRTSGVTEKLLYLIRDPVLVPRREPLRQVRRSRVALFVAIELLGFGATMAITQTIAAIGFPIVIMLLVPIRTWVVPRLPFMPEELKVLDGPTASPFTMASVGGSV